MKNPALFYDGYMNKTTSSFPSVFPTFLYGFGRKYKLNYQYDFETDEWIGWPNIEDPKEDDAFYDDPRWYSTLDQLRYILSSYKEGGSAYHEMIKNLQYCVAFGWGADGTDSYE